ncbi:DASH complex subunit Ask1-domain-containing protein [Circinella umbellata]|nr:DASH complex subunit Ask1-domain-containing protein [Circinella umbellata]
MSRRTDEEENVELEKLQQEVTLLLQAIDENFTRCQQIVSQGIIPEVERYATASKRVWEGLKVWVYFFQCVDKNVLHHQTNRPAFSGIPPEPISDPTPWDRLKDKFSPSSQDLSRLLHRPPHSHLPGSRTTATSATLTRPHVTVNRTNTYTTTGSSTGESSTTASLRHRTSPPETIPFRLSASELLQTPAREAANMLVDNTLRRIGAMSSPSSDDDDTSETSKQQQQSKPQEHNYGDETPKSWVANKDNEEGRERFEGFMQQRRAYYKDMAMDAELPVVRNRPLPKSPGHQQQAQDFTTAFPLPINNNSSKTASPSVNFDQDLRPPSKRTLSDFMDDDPNSLLPSSSPSTTTILRNEGHDNVEEEQVDELDEEEDEDMGGAFEFSQIQPSDLVAPHTDDRQSGMSTPSGSVGGISVSSSASQLPKEFSLHYFSNVYREPPASTELTRIYTLFEHRPGQSISVDQATELLDDRSFTSERVKLYIDVLASKKFLKKASAGRWILRQ